MCIIAYLLKFVDQIYQIDNLFYVKFSSEVTAVPDIHHRLLKDAIQDIGEQDGHGQISERESPFIEGGKRISIYIVVQNLKNDRVMQQIHRIRDKAYKCNRTQK